jgi:hypothetical protein
MVIERWGGILDDNTEEFEERLLQGVSKKQRALP